MFDRAIAIDTAFVNRLETSDLPVMTSNLNLTPQQLADVFDTQMMSRHLDLMARRTKGQTFYTIGSSGHEGLAALALASRNSDMAFLHYRDAAFCIQRRKAVTGSTPLWDMCLSFTASAEDPVSGGRHKVLGGVDIMTPPQTSTIASHLPKAVGAAHALCLGHSNLPRDSVILCSFGDASSNHSTAQGAMNSAAWAAYQGSPMPVVFICEDNNIGISVRTPKGWIEANYKNRPGLHYIECDGTDIVEALKACQSALAYTRSRRKPVFLHFKTVRLMGHAGADIESKYSSRAHIETIERHDPLIKTAAYLVQNQIMAHQDIMSAYATDAALRAAGCINDGRALTLNKMINKTLTEIMVRHENTLVFGEDVARKGGVYGVTMDLLKQFGPSRVQDTLLDEQTILGIAIGAAQTGYLPIPEIQFLAYLHNAEDQIRGEAATLSFFSRGQFSNPMVIRIAGLAYQRGFGGHFHNDNSIAVLDKRIVIFLEPIALYATSDLHSGDKAWTGNYKPPNMDAVVKFGEISQYGQGTDICVLTYGNGYFLSRQALDRYDNIRIIDMRWLHPLPLNEILKAIKPCDKILIVDECRATGSLSETLMAQLLEAKVTQAIERITGHDSFIPLGKAAYTVLPSVEDIQRRVEAML